MTATDLQQVIAPLPDDVRVPIGWVKAQLSIDVQDENGTEEPSSSPQGDLLRAPEVAAMLDLSTDRVYALARQGRIPNVKIGRSVRFARAAVQQWVEDGGEALPGGWKMDPDA